MRKELLIGCGANREKRLHTVGAEEWSGLITLDNNLDHKPDVLWDLMQMPLPFADNEFDEIHAYEVLEHTGAQGDYRFFFAQWSEFWRIMKPNGLFFGTVPSLNSIWAWGDPSHTRVIPPAQFNFLNQEYYKNVGSTPMSDFRSIYKADLKLGALEEGESTKFVLQAHK